MKQNSNTLYQLIQTYSVVSNLSRIHSLDLTRQHGVTSPMNIPTSVNEFGSLIFMCSSDDNPDIIADRYTFISMTNFSARSPSFGSLIIVGDNLTRNLDNATYTCRTISKTGEIYESQYIPFRVLCKLSILCLSSIISIILNFK